jgi:predicted Zn-dependent peptidase
MHFKKTTLKNGLRIITMPMKGTQTSTVLVIVGTGSKYESRETSGISHFLEHLFFKGTKKRPNKLMISEDLEKIGADYNAFTSKEYTGFYVRAASFQLDKSMEIVSDMLKNSTFPAEEIEKERSVILEEIKMIKDDPPRYVADLFEVLLYGDTPAGWDTAGTPESVSKITREQIISYLNTQYTAKNIAVVVAGAIDNKTILDRVKKCFSKFNGGEFMKKEAVKESQDKPEILIYPKETEQTHISLGVRGYDINHPDKYALSLLSVILGGGMSSRLFSSIREKHGLAYYIFSGAESYTDSGYFTTQAGIDSKNLTKTIGLILEEYRKIAEEGVGKKELQKVKDYIKGRTLMSLESSSSMANFLADQEILEGEIITYEEKLKKIDAVTTKDIQRVAKDIFKTNNINLAIVGNGADKSELQKILRIG